LRDVVFSGAFRFAVVGNVSTVDVFVGNALFLAEFADAVDVATIDVAAVDVAVIDIAAVDSAAVNDAASVVDDAPALSSFAVHCGHIVLSFSSVLPQGTWRNP